MALITQGVRPMITQYRRPIGAGLAGTAAAYSYANNPSYWNNLAWNAGKSLLSLYKNRQQRAVVPYRAPVKRVVKSVLPKPIRGKPSLKKQVKSLTRSIKSTMGTLIYRKRTTERLLTSINEKGYGIAQNQVDMNLYETVLGELRFFNPSAPGTLIQGSGASGTYFREYNFKNVTSKLCAKNNYQVPCKFTVMLMCSKEDTSINPATAFQNGLVDVGNPSSQSQLTYFTDSDEFNKLWSIKKTKKKLLQPGQELKISHSYKDMMYDPAVFDSHSLTFQNKYKTFCWLIKVEGRLGHDTSADQQGLTQAGVDIVVDNVLKVEYDAGCDLKFIVVSDGSDSFTNGAVTSSKPVSDNIGYSVA